jgi:hypothetical protein
MKIFWQLFISVFLYPSRCFALVAAPNKPGTHTHTFYSRSSTEQIALEALYDATNGDSWTSSSGWKTGSDLNNWFRVTATSSTVVTAVQLTSNNLAGV